MLLTRWCYSDTPFLIIFRPHRSGVARSVCLLVDKFVNPAKTAEPIEMPLRDLTHEGSGKHVLHGVSVTQSSGQFLGVVGPSKNIGDMLRYTQKRLNLSR